MIKTNFHRGKNQFSLWHPQISVRATCARVTLSFDWLAFAVKLVLVGNCAYFGTAYCGAKRQSVLSPIARSLGATIDNIAETGFSYTDRSLLGSGRSSKDTINIASLPLLHIRIARSKFGIVEILSCKFCISRGFIWNIYICTIWIFLTNNKVLVTILLIFTSFLILTAVLQYFDHIPLVP